MSGTVAGGKNAAITNKEKYGAGFYAKIGALGGKLGRTGGFWADRELARTAGILGGRKSRRGKARQSQATPKEVKVSWFKRIKRIFHG